MCFWAKSLHPFERQETHMPPQNESLPEGTDQIVAGASRTETVSVSGGPSAGTAISSTSSGTSTSGGSSGGFVAKSGGNDTGGSSGGGSSSSGGGSSGGSGGGLSAEKIASQVRSQVYALRDQATDKARTYAEGGKDRTTGLLDELASVINDAAANIDERIGDQYGEYARRAGDAVSSLSGSLRDKSIEDLIEDTRGLVRKSPTVTVGTAALLGFLLVRLVKTGLDTTGGSTGGQSSGNGATGA
jgi:ElaB/YqjD/DUF883 family membrane-anchored ribosome-binding protein